MSQKVLLNKKEVNIILHRLACQLIEKHIDFSNTILVGLQPRGKFLANRLRGILINDYSIQNVQIGFLDITFYRDDFRRSDKVLNPNSNEMEFIVEGKNVVFIDDVLFTGRSIRAALTAIQSYGRPNSIELLILIDRRFSRHLPIQPDYIGKSVNTLDSEKIIVNWKEENKSDKVLIIKSFNE